MEVSTSTLAVVIEAKKGFGLPTTTQLTGYLPRLAGAPSQALVTVSDYGAPLATRILPSKVQGVAVSHLAWRDLMRLARAARGKSSVHARSLLDDFETYLEGAIAMQRLTSNEVMVFALNATPFGGSGPSSIDIVTKFRVYSHPLGRYWPVDPPNCVGFRWNGHLQSVHHVEAAVPVNDLHETVPEVPLGASAGPHIRCRLGPPIRPAQPVRSGLPRDTRVRAAIDPLLTSSTVAEAAARTKSRLATEAAPQPNDARN